MSEGATNPWGGVVVSVWRCIGAEVSVVWIMMWRWLCMVCVRKCRREEARANARSGRASPGAVDAKYNTCDP